MPTYKGKKVTVRELAEGDPKQDKAMPKVGVTAEGGGPEEIVNKADVQP